MSQATVIAPPPQPTIPVGDGTQVFPLRRIYCVGRNYAEHTIEMGGDPDREDPFFFQKNPDSVLTHGADMPYPPKTQDLHFEVELAVALKLGGRNIPVERALDHVYGYAVAIDMTRRDLQGQMKDGRRPWEIGKSFEHSCPISNLVPAEAAGDMSTGSITLDVNGTRRQDGDLGQMIWKLPEIISYLSEYFELAAGDVILTGTPAGVGAVDVGDTLVGTVERIGTVTTTLVAAPAA